MVFTKRHSTSGLIWYSIIPSSTSGIFCALAGVVTVAVGVLQAASNQGTAVDGINAGVHGRESSIPSLDHIPSRGSWGDMGIAVVWVIALILLCGLLEFLFGVYVGFKSAREKAGNEKYISERRWLLERAYFRLLVGLLAVTVGLFLIRAIHWASTAEKTQVGLLQVPLVGVARRMALATLIWASTYHIVVVFTRLFIFRPRIFATDRPRSLD